MDADNTIPMKISLPSKDLSPAQLAINLNVIAKQYNTSLPSVIRKLDRVSGNLRHLVLLLSGDTRYEWTQQQDKLLSTNEGVLIRWKGQQNVKKRKQYLAWQKNIKK